MIVYIQFLPNDQIQYCIIQTVLAEHIKMYQVRQANKAGILLRSGIQLFIRSGLFYP